MRLDMERILQLPHVSGAAERGQHAMKNILIADGNASEQVGGERCHKEVVMAKHLN
jgi:hypothetical protein